LEGGRCGRWVINKGGSSGVSGKKRKEEKRSDPNLGPISPTDKYPVSFLEL
jgi:hypothetical protein